MLHAIMASVLDGDVIDQLSFKLQMEHTPLQISRHEALLDERLIVHCWIYLYTASALLLLPAEP